MTDTVYLWICRFTSVVTGRNKIKDVNLKSYRICSDSMSIMSIMYILDSYAGTVQCIKKRKKPNKETRRPIKKRKKRK